MSEPDENGRYRIHNMDDVKSALNHAALAHRDLFGDLAAVAQWMARTSHTLHMAGISSLAVDIARNQAMDALKAEKVTRVKLTGLVEAVIAMDTER